MARLQFVSAGTSLSTHTEMLCEPVHTASRESHSSILRFAADPAARAGRRDGAGIGCSLLAASRLYAPLTIK